jgi:hypothetical protein
MWRHSRSNSDATFHAHCGDGAGGTGDCGYQSFGAAMIGLPTGVRVWIAAGHPPPSQGDHHPPEETTAFSVPPLESRPMGTELPFHDGTLLREDFFL